MGYTFPPDLDQLVREQMADGSYASEDDLLRDALSALAERRADLAAIRAGIEDMHRGRVRPSEEVFDDVRARLPHGGGA
jgi:antitoxin ParD1/3/4